VAVVQYTFTHKQYIEQHNSVIKKNYISFYTSSFIEEKFPSPNIAPVLCEFPKSDDCSTEQQCADSRVRFVLFVLLLLLLRFW